MLLHTRFSFMKLLWPLAFVLSIIATAAGTRRTATNVVTTGAVDAIYFASFAAAAAILAGLLADYYRATGLKYRGSDLTSMRVAVITVANFAVILLALQFWSAGLGLSLLTAAFFVHGTVRAKELTALHAEWEAERAHSVSAKLGV